MPQRPQWPTSLALCLLLNACGGGVTNPFPPSTPGTPNIPPTVDSGPPFAPRADDLPAATSSIYPYPNALLRLSARYVNTPVAGPGNYLDADKRCSPQNSPPGATYPNGLVTLDTVNLDESKNDACEPEIKLQLSGDALPAASAKLRQRGSSSRLAEQKSYRIKYDSGTPWFGEDTFQLNKHPWDLTRVRNKLAFDLMREVPHHPSLRTQFVQLQYDDSNGTVRDMGLFTHVEKMGKSYLARRGWVAGSNVYKAENFSFSTDDLNQLTTKPDGSAGPDFEKSLSIEADSKQHQAIIQTIKDINNENKDFNTVFNQHFNRNNYLTWLGTAILLGNYDTQTQNFGLYQPLGTEKFYFLPWDYDGALGYPQQPGAEAHPEWTYGIGTWWANALHRRFMQQPGNITLLTAAVAELRQKYFTDARVQALLNQYRPTVEPLITQAPDLTNLPSQPQGNAQAWATEYQRLLQVIEHNHQTFLQSLQAPLPYWIAASAQGNALQLDWGWPTPFHPQGKPMTYRVEVARKPGNPSQAFDNATLVRQEGGLRSTQWRLEGLPAGEYLLRVTASDAQGHSTSAFNRYAMQGQEILGAMCVQWPSGQECP
ncbi:spore coat protein CotH [Acidovorax sp. HDW3]|uniref:CotH kinase family protein n=1 Tax=Acidovorax sp. HDW3 TaxID=2714923 RepID=UPI00140AA512|nr:CotH kinase family protein [Acidovorax sp. HDW3]QIL43945.1 spore coat protein CotH [Acidovorax sp. HDW3]